MEVIADLHIHGRYSRGCSTSLDFDKLEKYAKIKGIDLLGTGDFSHPRWLKEIQKLQEDGSGFLKSNTGFPFVLQNEYSFIYSQGGIGRRIHLCILAPNLATVEKINAEMRNIGRLDYDGRPIFGISCEEFVKKMMAISTDIEIFPAHIWTPWFSLFGSKSGFNSIKECFGEQVKNIHAIETGLSSDPEMNWRLSQLDNFTILSFSDSHSYWPWRLGREATIFEMDMTYDSLIYAIRNQKIKETIEVDPSYGKYHEDGHRKCGVHFTPKESLKHNNICPVCKRPLTIGVMQRVEELADRPYEFRPENRPGFRKLLPLHELIAHVKNMGIATKGVWNEYYKILKKSSEYHVLLYATYDELLSTTIKEIADAIILNREGKIFVQPGYDGVYGLPYIGNSPPPKAQHAKSYQKNLFDFD